MIQGNIIDPGSKIVSTFDIKGSTKYRYSQNFSRLSIETLDKDIVYKDQDFDKVMGYINLDHCDMVKNTIKSDLDILRQNKLMDYSLLFGV